MNCMCFVCGRSFTKASNLNRHMKEVHYETEQSWKADELKKRPHSTDIPGSRVICDICSCTFYDKSTYNKHFKRRHSGKDNITLNSYNEHCKKIVDDNIAVVFSSKQCPYCDWSCNKGAELDSHIESTHNIEMQIEHGNFVSVEEFNLWKKEKEDETSSKFIKRSSSGRIMYYICHRSGQPRYTNNPKQLKRKESVKIGKCCPARIRVEQTSEGSINATFYKTHAGHSLSFNDEERQDNDEFMGLLVIKDSEPNQENLQKLLDTLVSQALSSPSNVISQVYHEIGLTLQKIQEICKDANSKTALDVVINDAHPKTKENEEMLKSGRLSSQQNNMNISVQFPIETDSLEWTVADKVY